MVALPGRAAKAPNPPTRSDREARRKGAFLSACGRIQAAKDRAALQIGARRSGGPFSSGGAGGCRRSRGEENRTSFGGGALAESGQSAALA